MHCKRQTLNWSTKSYTYRGYVTIICAGMHPAFPWLCYSLLWLTFYCITFRLSSFLPLLFLLIRALQRRKQDRCNQWPTCWEWWKACSLPLFASSIQDYPSWREVCRVPVESLGITSATLPFRYHRWHWHTDTDQIQENKMITCIRTSHLAQFSFRCCNTLAETCLIVFLVPNSHDAWDPGTRLYNNPCLVIYFVKIILF